VNPAIVHVASGREWRGGQRQVWLLARELGRLGVNQVVITGDDSELASRLRASGVRVRPAAWRPGLDPRVIWPILGELHHRPAILHAHDAHALTLAGVCATLTGAPLVATRRVDFHLSGRGYWARADRIIAISNAVAEVLAGDGIPRTRITVVYSGISLEATRGAARLGIRERLGLAADASIAANVAALVPHKDHATLIDAAKRLEQRFPSLHWVVAGEGELRPVLEEHIYRLGLWGRVHLIGHLDQPERLIADSNLFVMSSRQEGLGTSVLEAMALGIPIASTTAGGLPELVGKGAGLLVPPREPAALAEAVGRILDEVELRQELIQRAQVEVLRFTDQRMAEEVGLVYRSCAHSLDGS
jgi:glycosyltransferase involved in cell wall biosynthesis